MRRFVYNNPFLFVFSTLLSLCLYHLNWGYWFVFAVFASLSFARIKTGLFVLFLLIIAVIVFHKPKPERIKSKRIEGVVYDVRKGTRLILYVKTRFGRVFLFTSKLYDNIDPRDRISFRGKLRPIGEVRKRSFKLYLLSAGFSYIGFAGRIRKLGNVSLLSFVENIRKTLEREFYYFLDERTSLFLQNAIFGDMSNRSSIRKAFIDTQTAHIMSVSGLHMGFVFGVFYFVIFRIIGFIKAIYLRCNLKRLASLLALMPTLLYFMISGMHIPALRSFIMVVVFIYALIGGYGRFSYNLLFFVATIIVFMGGVFTPLNPSFVLSFLMSFVAISIYRVVAGMNRLKAFLIFSVMISIFSIPITVYYFHLFSPVAFLGNLFVVPYFGFVIMPLSFIAMLVSLQPLLPLKYLVFDLLGSATHALLSFVSFASKIVKPVGVEMNLWGVLLCYAVMFAALFYLSKITSTSSRYSMP